MTLLRTLRAFGAAVVLPLMASLPAWAEEAEAGGGNLPQFDATYFPEQIFWLLVSFLALYLLMAFVIVPRFARTQDNRTKVIAEEIETARAANDDARATMSKIDVSLGEARDKAQGRVSEMLAKVAEEALKQKTTQERDLLRRVRAAEESIARSKAAAMEEVQQAAEDLATAVVHEILEAKKQRVKA